MVNLRKKNINFRGFSFILVVIGHRIFFLIYTFLRQFSYGIQRKKKFEFSFSLVSLRNFEPIWSAFLNLVSRFRVSFSYPGVFFCFARQSHFSYPGDFVFVHFSFSSLANFVLVTLAFLLASLVLVPAATFYRQSL
jgi:hypothetical protein